MYNILCGVIIFYYFNDSIRYNTPVWLVTDNRQLAETVMKLIPGMISELPELNGAQAALAWRDYGEVILCTSRSEMLSACNEYAPEHLHVQAEDLPWWLDNLTSYGSLFLGVAVLWCE